MSQRHYPPAYLRYLKARLWSLARPSFWGTAIFLSVVGLVIKEYWTHPDFLTQLHQQTAASQSDDLSLSKEERARVADIDNLPVLYNESEQNDSSATTNTSFDQKTNKSLLDELNQKSQSSTLSLTSNSAKDTVSAIAPPTIDNPFLVQAQNLLQMSNYTSGNNSLEVNPKVASSVQPSVTQNSSQNVAPINTLQTSLNQSTQNSSNPSNSTSNPINRVSQSSPSNNLPSQTTQSTTVYTQPTTTNLVPNTQTNINPNSYTQPTVTNVQPNYSGFGYTQQPTVTNVPPNTYNNYNTTQTLPNLAQPTQVVSPAVTYAAPINTAPYTQTPSQSVVNSTTPVAPNNYNNTVVQPLNSLPQYNPLSPSRQVLKQPTVYGQSNTYSYP